MPEIHEHQVVVGAAGHEIESAVEQSLGECLCVVDDLLLISLEFGLERLAEADSLCRDDMHERTALRAGEYSGVEFKWTTDEVSANGETLFFGMPVWSVYLADLNGDGLREIASCASLGSGIIDERIYVYDYSSKQLYVLKNRMKSDFTLFMNNGEVWVRESKYASDDVIRERKLALSEMECGSDF